MCTCNLLDADNVIHVLFMHIAIVIYILFPFKAFEQWKAEVEEKESCSFIKTTGMKSPVRYYQCNQGGVYKPKGTGKRQIKSQGTRSVKSYC